MLSRICLNDGAILSTITNNMKSSVSEESNEGIFAVLVVDVELLVVLVLEIFQQEIMIASLVHRKTFSSVHH